MNYDEAYNLYFNYGVYDLFTTSIALDVIELIQIYQKEELSDKDKKNIFDKSIEILDSFNDKEDLMNYSDSINELKEEIKNEVEYELEFNPINDLKDSYYNQ